MKKVIVVIGAGSNGQAIARRVSAGKHVLLADLRPENAHMAAKVLSEAEAGFAVATSPNRSSIPFLMFIAKTSGPRARFIRPGRMHKRCSNGSSYT